MHILITGGTRGLGYCLTLDCLDSGHTVHSIGRSTWDHAQPAIPDLPWDTYDAVVFNAGIAIDGVLPGMTQEQISTSVQVNLVSAMCGTMAYIRKRLATEHPGVVVYISSLAAEHGFKGLSVYGGTKAGLLGFMRGMAREWGSYGWRFNAICPGFLETDMTAAMTEHKRHQLINRTPLHRLGTPQDIAPMVRFLLSDAASWMTGQVVTIDGGLTC